MMRQHSRWQTATLIAILALALALRVYHLGNQSLWNDEGTSVALAQRSLAEITRGAANDIHPPLYYYLLHYWIKIWGSSEVAVRGLSVVLGMVLVWGVYALGRRLFGISAGLLAALFAAAAPFQVYYAQETRMYMLVSATGLLSILAFHALVARWQRTNEWRQIALPALLYLVSTVATVYSHYMGLAIFIAQNFAFLAWLGWRWRLDPAPCLARWRQVWPWALLQALVLLAYLPWLVLSWGSLSSWPAVHAPLSLSYLFGEAARLFAFGVAVAPRLRTLWIGVALAALATPALFARVPCTGDTDDDRQAQAWRLILALLYLLTPIILIYVLSLQRPMYKPKFLLLATPPYFLLQAFGILSLGRLARRLAGKRAQLVLLLIASAGVCAASAWGLAGVYGDETYRRDDYRGIAAYITASSHAADAILINAPAQIETFDYYYHGALPEYPLPAQRPIDRADTERALERIVARHERIYAVFWATNESDPDGFIENWLDARCFKAMDSWFGNVRLVVYAVPAKVSSTIADPRQEIFGQQIRLRGYTLINPIVMTNDILQLSLFWEALAPIEARYKVFTHLVDARGNIVAQRDSEPAGGGRPTTSWQPGEVVIDNTGILVPPGTPPGEHTLRVGLYGLEDGQRLSVTEGTDSLGDALDLGKIPVYLSPVSPPIGALGVRKLDEASWGWLELVGHNSNRLGYDHEPEAPLRPGDTVSLVLFWRRGVGSTAPEQFTLSLVSRRQGVVWQQPLAITDGMFPHDEWQEGQIIRDAHRFILPQELPLGELTLVLDQAGATSGYSLQKLTLTAP